MEGLFKATFGTPLGSGDGVVYLQGGTLHGGDSAIFYTGSYKIDGQKMTATFRIGRHSTGMPSVLGTDSAQLSMVGEVRGNQIVATATSPQAPGVKLNVVLSPLAA